jgi:chromosome segregation ATPase
MTPSELAAIEARANATGPISLIEIHANNALELLNSDAYSASTSAKDLGAEVIRLRKLVTELRSDIPALLAEVRRLQTECDQRKSHLAHMDEGLELLVSQRSALRAENEALKSQCRLMLQQREEYSVEPRYSTDAVDALLDALDDGGNRFDNLPTRVDSAAEAVRSSREPQR